MGSMNHRQMFGPLDLEIVERVYEVACRHIEARNLYRETANIAAEAENLRKMVFACATNGRLEFDTLCEKVLARLSEISRERRAA